MIQEPLKLMRRCPTCDGEGDVVDLHCRECGRLVSPTDPWWETDDEALPCGHPGSALAETMPCPECDGKGRYPQEVSRTEWERARRRKIIIGAVLFVAFLVPFMALAAAVADAYPNNVCGSGWYGAIIIGMLIVGQQRHWLM